MTTTYAIFWSTKNWDYWNKKWVCIHSSSRVVNSNEKPGASRKCNEILWYYTWLLLIFSVYCLPWSASKIPIMAYLNKTIKFLYMEKENLLEELTVKTKSEKEQAELKNNQREVWVVPWLVRWLRYRSDKPLPPTERQICCCFVVVVDQNGLFQSNLTLENAFATAQSMRNYNKK